MCEIGPGGQGGSCSAAVRRLEAGAAIARAVGAETDLDRVLELIVTRGRAIVDARGMMILLRDGGELAVAAAAGDVPAGVEGMHLESPRAGIDHLGIDPDAAVTVPLVFRGQSLGLLVTIGRRDGDSTGAQDERLLAGFAATAAMAVATARSVEQQRLRDIVRGAEEERTRWARELHDETLQGLGALRMLLASGRRAEDPERLRAAVDAVLEQLGTEIDALRSLIRELRPAALDELGPQPAIEDLAARTATRSGVDVSARVALSRHPHELEITLYRVIQEAVANAVRHAGAEHVAIDVTEDGSAVIARVADDGAGFDPGAASQGFGLAAMRERVSLLSGSLEIASAADGAGTVVTAVLPVPRHP